MLRFPIEMHRRRGVARFVTVDILDDSQFEVDVKHYESIGDVGDDVSMHRGEIVRDIVRVGEKGGGGREGDELAGGWEVGGFERNKAEVGDVQVPYLRWVSDDWEDWEGKGKDILFW